jgi:hypothetical protein
MRRHRVQQRFFADYKALHSGDTPSLILATKMTRFQVAANTCGARRGRPRDKKRAHLGGRDAAGLRGAFRARGDREPRAWPLPAPRRLLLAKLPSSHCLSRILPQAPRMSLTGRDAAAPRANAGGAHIKHPR